MMSGKRKKDRVLVFRCEDYDRKRIQEIVQAGITGLNYEPCGNIFVKPNVVYAAKKDNHQTTTFTNTSLVGGVLEAVAQHDKVQRIDLGEGSGIGYPTRLCFKYAGYYKEIHRTNQVTNIPIGIFCMEEGRRDRLFVGGRVHDNLRIHHKMARADSKVYLPKLKRHCVTTVTGAVKLNIGVCSPDERAIRHDYMLNEKIVDLLTIGYPDLIVMDAIDVGVGNELRPISRKLGLIIMGTNPMAVDLVGARLLGYNIEDVAHLKLAAERGYTPGCLENIEISGDFSGVPDLGQAAKRLQPYDDEFNKWQDLKKELKRLNSPIRFLWGYAKPEEKLKCATGCVMAIKMFLAFLEDYAGADAFRQAKPVVLVVGKIEGTIDAKGEEVFLIGSCSYADVINAKKINKIDRCFSTALDLAQNILGKLGIPAPILDLKMVLPLAYNQMLAAGAKLSNRRYFQDISLFIKKDLIKRI